MKLRTIGLAIITVLLSQTAFAQKPASGHDGAKDFDFEFGTWKVHLKRLLHPLSGSSEWAEMDGTSTVNKLWDGKGNIGELKLDSGSTHIQGMSLRLFNPETQQWSIYWANARDGNLTPPLIGGFRDGVGEFCNQDTFNGKLIFARFLFTELKADSFKIEQAFSPDGGKTWETNWITTFTKMPG